MGDTYQPIYDAVRSRIGHADLSQAVSDAINQQANGLSWAIDAVRLEYAAAADAQRLAALETQRPSVLYRPAIYVDGDQWCALYGGDLQRGVCGFGDSPAEAMSAFNKAWDESLSATTARHTEGA